MKEGERQCVQARKTKLNFREIKSNLNNTMGETLNAQRNQQRNSNNKRQQQQEEQQHQQQEQQQQIHCKGSRERDKSNKDIIKYIAAYLSLSQFLSTLPPAPPSTQPLPLRPQPFFSLLLSSIVYMLRASFDMPAELN